MRVKLKAKTDIKYGDLITLLLFNRCRLATNYDSRHLAISAQDIKRGEYLTDIFIFNNELYYAPRV